MIHEDRVRQMIKLAVYDENKSMGEKKPAQYFRKDYLALEMIKSFFCGTMAYAIIVILGAVYLLGNGAGDISTVNFIRILILTVVLYAVFLGIGFKGVLPTVDAYADNIVNKRMFFKNLEGVNYDRLSVKQYKLLGNILSHSYSPSAGNYNSSDHFSSPFPMR